MTGKLSARKEIAKNVLEVSFGVPDEFVFEPGQYAQVILGDKLKHYFSIVNSPNQKNLYMIATRITPSDFKQRLRTLEQGSEVEINGPWGDFLLPRNLDKIQRSLNFVAGGIGITPFISILRYKDEERLSYNFKLFHFNHDDLAIPFLEETKRYGALQKIGEFVWDEAMDKDGLFYVSGPPGFVNKTCGYLEARGMRPQNIITDSFTGY